MPSHANLKYRRLEQLEIEQLRAQGCTAQSWSDVSVAEPFLADRVVQVAFAGKVKIAPLTDDSSRSEVDCLPAGLYRATISDCEFGTGVRVANVWGHLSRYHVGDGAQIENVGVMHTAPGARFGAGVEVAVLNEAGGREVSLFPGLSSQFAHMLCLYRNRRDLVERLQCLADQAAQANERDFGTVGEGAVVRGVPRIVGVDIGPSAIVDSAQALENGTILSHPDAPTTVQNAVIAADFIIAEGSIVSDAAILSHTFVGQGCQIGKQFSAENCLFFANCEALHGEGCSALAGPYTVTHHKSTLLIGGLFSFFNAGSGTNQSNHRYKLGPTHEGKLERGCKTGSSSYIMWPCRVGPFSVVLGKHTRSFDTANLPFSHLEADATGKCDLIPGHYIATVGTLRDGAKWPKRDRRTGPVRRDVLCFDVFSPLTIGRMQRGLQLLEQLQEQADRAVETVTTGGVTIKRVLLRTGRKRYAAYIDRYLLEQLVGRLEDRIGSGHSIRDAVAADESAVYSAEWLDVGGQLLPRERFERISNAIVTEEVNSVEHLQTAFEQAHAKYATDIWIWTKQQLKETGLVDLDTVQPAELMQFVNQYCEQQQKFLRLVLVDAQREFDEVSQTGFGIWGEHDATSLDFSAVRGRYEDNSFVQMITAEIDSLPNRCERLCKALAGA